MYSSKNRGKKQFSKQICEEEIEHTKDQMNVIYVNEIVTKLFQGHKFKPDRFHLWTMEPGSICHTITQNGNIGWSREFPKERYWSENIVPMVNANLVNNITQQMQSRYIGMCLMNIFETILYVMWLHFPDKLHFFGDILFSLFSFNNVLDTV